MDDPLPPRQSPEAEPVPPLPGGVAPEAVAPDVEPPPNGDRRSNTEGETQQQSDDSQHFTSENPFGAGNFREFRDANFNYYNYQTTDKGEEKREFRAQEVRLFAASKPMPTSNPDFHHNEEDLNKWVSELRTRRLLFLISYDGSSLYSAAQEMVSKLGNYYQPFVLSPESKFPSNASISVDPCLPALEGDPAAVFVADARSSTSLLDSAMKIGLVQENLRYSNWLLILLANDEILGWTEDPERKQAEYDHVPCVRVPFLMPRLRRAFPSDWEELYEEVCCQRRIGQWIGDEKKFYNDILSYLCRGLLREEVEKRRQGKTLTVSPPQIAELRAEQSLSPATPLENTVLFLATFFPGLQMHDFTRFLLSLLGDGLVPATKFRLLVPESEEEVEEMGGSQLLREVWSQTYPEVLAKCRLQTQVLATDKGSGSSLTFVVDFTEPESRDQLRSAFFGLHTSIFLDLLRLVREARFIFDEDQQVAEAAVRFMAEAAGHFPREFACAGLGGLVPLADVFASGDAVAKILLQRLYACLRAFLQRPTLRELVTRFLQERFSARYYDELLELIWLLRNVADFDALFWFKRLLDEGDEDARRRVHTKLYRAVRSGGSVEMLQGLSRWLPQVDSQNISPSAAFSLSFLVDLNEGVVFDSRLPRPRNPLLMASSRDVGHGLVKLVVRWLFHPAVASLLVKRTSSHFRRWVNSWLIPSQLRVAVFDRRFEDRFSQELEGHWEKARSDSAVTDPQDLERLLFPALVLADWAAELLNEDSLYVEARALFDHLLDTLVEVCSVPRRRVLGNLWATIEESLLDLLVFVEQLDPRPFDLDRGTIGSLREELRARRRCVKQLRLDLQARGRAAKTH